LHLLLIAFYILIGIQLVYFLIFIFTFSKRSVPNGPQPNPVSVIVCAHDEEENLRELIPQLLSQDHVQFEVIIVDDRSNDGTFDLLLAETAKDHKLRMVHVNRTPPHVNSKKYALTLGIRAARYEWILLSDADCRPVGKGWISGISSHFTETKNFVLGYSPYQTKGGLLNAFIRFDTLLTGVQYLSFAMLGIPFMGVGRNLAYRRSMFLKVKGFNDILPVTGGDDDLFVNQHARSRDTAVSLEIASQMESIPKSGWSAFYHQKVRHLSVGKKYRMGHKILLGLFMITWLLAWFAGILLAYLSIETSLVLSLLGLRILVVVLTMQISARRLGQRFEIWLVPLLDFIYTFYYLVTGLRALVTQKVRWKS